eukprot:superscaffoldBa00002660_g14927
MEAASHCDVPAETETIDMENKEGFPAARTPDLQDDGGLPNFYYCNMWLQASVDFEMTQKELDILKLLQNFVECDVVERQDRAPKKQSTTGRMETEPDNQSV